MNIPKSVSLKAPGLREAVRLAPGAVFYSADGDLFVRVAEGALRIHDMSSTSDHVTAVPSVVTEATLRGGPFKAVTELPEFRLRLAIVGEDEIPADELQRFNDAAARLQAQLRAGATPDSTPRPPLREHTQLHANREA